MNRKSLLSVVGHTLLATILLTIAFICISPVQSPPAAVSQLVSEKGGTTKTLPFYSAKVMFSSCTFLISFVYILTQNLITYNKYGIFH